MKKYIVMMLSLLIISCSSFHSYDSGCGLKTKGLETRNIMMFRGYEIVGVGGYDLKKDTGEKSSFLGNTIAYILDGGYTGGTLLPYIMLQDNAGNKYSVLFHEATGRRGFEDLYFNDLNLYKIKDVELASGCTGKINRYGGRDCLPGEQRQFFQDAKNDRLLDFSINLGDTYIMNRDYSSTVLRYGTIDFIEGFPTVILGDKRIKSRIKQVIYEGYGAGMKYIFEADIRGVEALKSYNTMKIEVGKVKLKIVTPANTILNKTSEDKILETVVNFPTLEYRKKSQHFWGDRCYRYKDKDFPTEEEQKLYNVSE